MGKCASPGRCLSYWISAAETEFNVGKSACVALGLPSLQVRRRAPVTLVSGWVMIGKVFCRQVVKYSPEDTLFDLVHPWKCL